MGTKWQMPIAVIGKPTGDGRQFDEGALSHRDLPLPLRYVASDSGGHNDAVIVGHIGKIGKEKDGFLPAEGEFYDDESWPENVREAATAARMFTANKVIGPSVDLDQAEMESVPEPKAYTAWQKEQGGKLKAAKMAAGGDCGCGKAEPYAGPTLRMVRKGRVASATLVHIPAFAELSGNARLTPIDSGDPNVGGTTSSIAAGATADESTEEIFGHLFGEIENDVEMAAKRGMMSEPDEDDMVMPGRGKRKKRDPETVKGNQDTQEMSDEGSGIWLTDDEYARKRLPRPSKDKGSGPEMPSGDAEQSGGAGATGGTYRDMDPNVGGGTDRDKLADEDFVDPKGRRFPIATCADVSDAVSSYGRANPKIPMAEFRKRLTAIARRKGCEDSLPQNWKDQEKMAALMAAAVVEWKPPAAAFANPNLTAPTPLTIDDDGHVYGHVAVWNTCHVGIGDSCVKPPRSQTGYAYFHTGEVATADGERVAVGRLTYGGGHAASNLGYRAAAEHYDDTTQVGAYVRAGEDAHGIWVSGVLAPDVDEAGLRTMRAAPLSGDWRRVGGNLEMVAALHVNTAGFPIPRATVASGQPFALVAAGALPVDTPEETGGTGLDPTALGRAIAVALVAEQRAIAAREERGRRWQSVLAGANGVLHTVDPERYDQVRGELVAALKA